MAYIGSSPCLAPCLFNIKYYFSGIHVVQENVYLHIERKSYHYYFCDMDYNASYLKHACASFSDMNDDIFKMKSLVNPNKIN